MPKYRILNICLSKKSVKFGGQRDVLLDGVLWSVCMCRSIVDGHKCVTICISVSVFYSKNNFAESNSKCQFSFSEHHALLFTRVDSYNDELYFDSYSYIPVKP